MISPQPAERLLTCPRCGRTGFYARGILEHVCRGKHFLDPRRRLTNGELAAVGLEAKPAVPIDEVKVIVHFRGDCYHARAGRGAGATLASSTSAPVHAAGGAAEKYFGAKEDVLISLETVGSCSLGIPWRYLARRAAP